MIAMNSTRRLLPNDYADLGFDNANFDKALSLDLGCSMWTGRYSSSHDDTLLAKAQTAIGQGRPTKRRDSHGGRGDVYSPQGEGGRGG